MLQSRKSEHYICVYSDILHCENKRFELLFLFSRYYTLILYNVAISLLQPLNSIVNHLIDYNFGRFSLVDCATRFSH